MELNTQYNPDLAKPKVEFQSFTSETFTKYSAAMGERKYAMITNDYSGETGYSQEVVDNPPLPGTEVSSTTLIEKWDGGTRWVMKESTGLIRSEVVIGGIGIMTTKPGDREVVWQETQCYMDKLTSGEKPLLTDIDQFLQLAKGQLPPSCNFSASEEFYTEDGGQKKRRYLNASHLKYSEHFNRSEVYVIEEDDVLRLEKGKDIFKYPANHS